MADKKRYIYTCRVLPEKERDVAHEHQEKPVELDGGAADVGDVRQVAVNLDEKGVEAYLAASNIFPEEFEEVEVDSVDGWEEEEVADADSVGADAIHIPSDADTVYQKSLFLRDGKQGQGVKVAVLDTGLGNAVYESWLKDYVADGKSWVGGTYHSSTHNHGTHVATTALQENSKLIHCAVLDNNGSGGRDNIIAAIYWAVQQGADIVNMSLSGGGDGAAYERAIKAARDKGVLVVVSAGNEALRGNPLRYPANCPSAIAVGAFDRNTDRKAGFSSYHDYVDIAGSGVNVRAFGGNGQLLDMSGTSMSSPMVVWTLAGLAAQYDARGDALLRALRGGARENGSPKTHYGSGVCSGQGGKAVLTRPKEEAPAPEQPTGGLWRVQTGAFEDRENADEMAADLKADGYPAWVFQE